MQIDKWILQFLKMGDNLVMASVWFLAVIFLCIITARCNQDKGYMLTAAVILLVKASMLTCNQSTCTKQETDLQITLEVICRLFSYI